MNDSKKTTKEGVNKVTALCELHARACTLELLYTFPERISECEICHKKGTCYFIPIEKAQHARELEMHNVRIKAEEKERQRLAKAQAKKQELGMIEAKKSTELLLSEIPLDFKYVMLEGDERDLIKAINLMARYGWKCVNISMTAPDVGFIEGYALMERLNHN